MKVTNQLSLLLIFFLTSLFEQNIGRANTADTFNIVAKVDKRVELLSIVFRLAENEEYSTDYFKNYAADINKYFQPYKSHPLIVFAKTIADEKGISYDAVMAMAIQLNQPPLLTPIVSFNQRLPDPRWNVEDATKFISLLKQFYTQTNFENFFNEHTSLYNIAIKRFNEVAKDVDYNWYKSYYGRMPAATFNLIIGLGNGGQNYGPHLVYPNGREEMYAIMGTWSADSVGLPTYDKVTFLPTIIHEYNHSYINPLVENNLKELEKPAQETFNQLKEEMERAGWGNWKTMLYETLVRACVAQYIKKHDRDSLNIHEYIYNERKSGYIWIDSVINWLEYYETNRDAYPTFSSFMPQLDTNYDHFARNINNIKNLYEKKRPQVISLAPFENNAQNVDTSIKEIIINFSKSLNPTHFSIRLGEGGQEHMPITDLEGYTNNNQSLHLKVSLKPNWEYAFNLASEKFASADGYPLIEFKVSFKTKK